MTYLKSALTHKFVNIMKTARDINILWHQHFLYSIHSDLNLRQGIVLVCMTNPDVRVHTNSDVDITQCILFVIQMSHERHFE